MNKELNTQIEQIMADFNTRNKSLLSRIENLKKSEASIKDSFDNQFLEIIKVMKESCISCKKLLTDLFIGSPEYIKFKTIKAKWNVNCVKSLVNGKDFYGSYFIIAGSNCNDILIDIGITHDSFPRDNSHDWFYFNDNYNIEDKQTLAEWYLSGKFNESLLFIIKEAVNNYLKCQEEEITRIESVIENSQPLAKTESNWQDYIMYLLKWSSEHADKEFAGMSPACYDEWLDNEMEEE